SERWPRVLRAAGLALGGAWQGDGRAAQAHSPPRFMVRYLAWLARQPYARAFFDALPVLGRDGTLHDIQVKSAAVGHVHAKTGTYGEDDALNRAVFVNPNGLAASPATH